MEKVSDKQIYGYYKTSQLKANKKWREENPDKWREACKITYARYYETHRDDKNNKVKARYHYNKQKQILLDLAISFFPEEL